MKRHFNYTGRVKIDKEKLQIKVNKEKGIIKSVDATIMIDDLGFSDSASVYLEAYHRTDLERFHLGTIGYRIIPKISLSYLGHVENLLFRVKIVDESGKHGLIIAEADGIHPAEEGAALQKRSILPVEFDRELGQRVWHVAFDGDRPVLEFNKHIPDIRHMAKSDPGFFFYVYPQVIREILEYMFFIGRINDLQDPELDWHRDWLAFTQRIYSVLPPVSSDDSERSDINEEIHDWIDKVVEEFCGQQSGKWYGFVKSIGGVET